MLYIGIDLGTTNSVISSFNGSETRIWKSPEGQTDVTPSALFIDKRGNKFCGQKAYNFSSQYPDNSATLSTSSTQTVIFAPILGKLAKRSILAGLRTWFDTNTSLMPPRTNTSASETF